MVLQNLHCHTLFDDGKASPEAMVIAARDAGLSSVGVSLHSPIPGHKSWCCAEEKVPAFIAEMHRLRETYAGQITVYCGVEFDLDGICDLSAFDYVIASVHGLDDYSIDNTPEEAMRLIAHFGTPEKSAEAYYARMCDIAKLPEADIVGHFDLITKFDERCALYDPAAPAYRDAAFSAMEVLNAAGKIFEINSGAISRSWRTSPYPAPELLRHLKNLGGRICINSDAHSTDAIACAFDACEALARACGFEELWQFDGDAFRPVKI